MRRVQVKAVSGPDELGAVLESGFAPSVQGVAMLSSPLFFAYSARLAEAMQRRALPAISPFAPFARAGGLMAYGPDLPYFFRRAALYVDKLLRGERASELPIEQPTRFEFIVNRRAPKALGLALPPSLLVAADSVIG